MGCGWWILHTFLKRSYRCCDDHYVPQRSKAPSGEDNLEIILLLLNRALKLSSELSLNHCIILLSCAGFIPMHVVCVFLLISSR